MKTHSTDGPPSDDCPWLDPGQCATPTAIFASRVVCPRCQGTRWSVHGAWLFEPIDVSFFEGATGQSATDVTEPVLILLVCAGCGKQDHRALSPHHGT